MAGYTQADWAGEVLSDAGLPVTQNNVANITRWMVAEEPSSHWWNRNNPLNASLGTSASDGTGSYPDLSTGATYTARMIKQANMSGIFSALAANADVGTFSAAVVASPWASSHYGGNPNHIATIPVPTFVAAGVSPGTPQAAGGGAGGGGAPGYDPNAQVLGFPLLGTVINQGQALKIKGWFLMISGGVVAGVGMAIVLTAFGLESKVAKVVAGVTPVGRGARAVTGAASTASDTASEPATAGRRESREIERRFSETERQQGPIGPRGGNPTSTRIAQRERRGRSVQGARRHVQPPRERAAEPF